MRDVIEFAAIEEQGPLTAERDYSIDPSEISRPEIVGSGDVHCSVTVRTGDLEREYEAEGTVSFASDLECSRCVEAYPFANTSSFHVRFRPRPEASEENEEVEITNKEELDVEFYSEPVVSVRDLALEQIQLVIPMKPLCNEGCLGLCPVCGANRMREMCTCEQSVVDERWGALQGMRDVLAKKNDI